MILPLLLALQAQSGPVHHGRAGDLAVTVPRVERAEAVVDGALDEPVWRRAAVLTGFSQYRPVDGRPAEDSTEVLVWYAPDAIWFGIRAVESHGPVRATLADRDRIDSEDHVQILLDTFDDRRRAYVIGVNPLGVQGDGIRTEGSAGSAGGGGSDGRFENVDMNPDFVFDSRGRVHHWGYEIEIRIPFKSLRFPGTDPQRWALNVIRKVQHSGYEDTWTPAVRANASFLTQSGTLEGLEDLQRGLVLDLNPFATARADGFRNSAGAWEYDAEPEVGANATWGVTTNLTLDATVNPDFSQVEADVGQVTVNERFAVFFPEKRPFFLEGIELFNTPEQLIYTRRIVNPIAGAKLTGKISGTNVAVLSSVDAKSASADGEHHPVVTMARVRRDIGAQSTAGLSYTDRIVGSDWNRVGAADVRLIFGRMYYFEAFAGGSLTRHAGATDFGPIWKLTVDRTGRSWGFHYSLGGIHPDFQAQSGFVRRTGIVTPFIANRLTFYGAPGATLENWTGFFSFNGTWDYDTFFELGSPLETAVGHTSFFTLRGGWSARIEPRWETVAFDPAFYSGWQVETGADTVPFRVPGRLTDLVAVGVSASTPRFTTFSGSVSAGIGRSAAFFEPAPARELRASASLDWRPTDQLRVDAQYNWLALHRVRDGTRLSVAHIPRLKVEYQLSRPLFIRVVGQYDIQERDALRDPATDQPLLLPADDGGLTSATAVTTNDLRIDWLFSYRPVPGTVLFAGYGSSLTETGAFRFEDLRRVRDGFFLKVSWLFRV